MLIMGLEELLVDPLVVDYALVLVVKVDSGGDEVVWLEVVGKLGSRYGSSVVKWVKCFIYSKIDYNVRWGVYTCFGSAVFIDVYGEVKMSKVEKNYEFIYRLIIWIKWWNFTLFLWYWYRYLFWG